MDQEMSGQRQHCESRVPSSFWDMAWIVFWGGDWRRGGNCIHLGSFRSPVSNPICLWQSRWFSAISDSHLGFLFEPMFIDALATADHVGPGDGTGRNRQIEF